MDKKKIVTRIAPSPTSRYGLHVGNLRTMLFSYLFAKQNDGIFYLRIEDTDQDRFCDGAEELIKKSMAWLGIEPDFSPWSKEQPYGPMRQSERDYTKYIQYLLDNGYAYYAFDTVAELTTLRKEAELQKNDFSYNHSNRMVMKNSLSLPADVVKSYLDNKVPYTIRYKVIPNVEITFNDIVRGEITFNSSQMDDKVLVKTSGVPTYHLANICDDHDMGTTHIIRGDEWVSSTPLHIMIYNAFGWDMPQFAHLPLVLNPVPLKGKLSKRNAINLGIPIFPFGGIHTEKDKKTGKDVEFTLKGFVNEGYDPDALINFLMLLGWTPHHDAKDEIFSLQDGIDNFDLHNVHKAGARYDIEKLEFFNGWYLQNKTSDEELLKHITFDGRDADYGTLVSYSDDQKMAILDMAKKRSHFKYQMQSVVDIFTKHIKLTDKQKADISDLDKKALNCFVSKIWNCSDVDWTGDYIKQNIFNACEENGVKMKKIMPLMRTILAGGITGPDMISFMTILGKQQVICRTMDIMPLPTGGLAPLYKDDQFEHMSYKP